MKLKNIYAAIAAAAVMLTATACQSGETNTTNNNTNNNNNNNTPSVSDNNGSENNNSADDNDNAGNSGDETVKTDDGKIYKIGITQMMDHPALNLANEGFIAALADKGYVEGQNLDIDSQNGQGDNTNLNTIATQFVGNGVDLIFAIATPAAQAAQGQTQTIPIIGTAITDFAEAGLVDSNEVPGTNVSGTTDMNPISDQLDLMLRLSPDVKTVGFLYTSSEDNSILQTDIAKAYLDTLGLSWVERTISTTNDVQQAMASLVTECDAVFLPTDNNVASAMAIVSEVANEAKIPTICGESNMVLGGGFATLGINYYNLGYQAGLMAVRVLEGADISAMPIESSTNFDFCLNGEVADAIGITIPDDLQEFVVYPSAEDAA